MPLLFVAALAALVAEYWWAIALGGAAVWTVLQHRRAARRKRKALDIRSWLNAETSWRADRHLEWVLAGDPRWIHGEYPPVDLDRVGRPARRRGPAPLSPAFRRRSDVDALRRERQRGEIERARQRGTLEIMTHGDEHPVVVHVSVNDN